MCVCVCVSVCVLSGGILVEQDGKDKDDCEDG